jgi:1,4-dihydroxy-2-naphthoate octaprenyltransferase
VADMTTPVTKGEVWGSMLLYPRHTLPTAAAPVLVASCLAAHDRVFALGPALLAFLAGWLVQLGGVVTDNYNNLRRHGEDREHPRFVQALDEGVVTFGQLRAAIAACYGVALLAGIYLVAIGGVTVLLIGLASIAASLLYSSGPFPLGDRLGLGDPLFFVFFGQVSVMATYYVEAAACGHPGVTMASFLVSLPMAALTTNILVIDNIRDLEFDRAKDERTLAVILGPRWARVEYAALLALAYVVPFSLVARGFTPWGPASAALSAVRDFGRAAGVSLEDARGAHPQHAARGAGATALRRAVGDRAHPRLARRWSPERPSVERLRPSGKRRSLSHLFSTVES